MTAVVATKAVSLRHRLLRAQGETAAILDAAVDGIITISHRGIIREFNRAAEALFGYHRDEAIGHDVSLLMPEPDRSRHPRHLTAYQATGKAAIIGIGREVLARHKNGATFPIHLAVGESRVAGQRVFTGIVHDLTAAKATEQRLKKSEVITRTILETAVDGIVTADQDGTILAVNPAAERIFGYDTTELAGRNIMALMPEAYRTAHQRGLARHLATGERTVIGRCVEFEGLRQDGSVFPMDLTIGEAVIDDGTRIFTGIVRDITERKRLERETHQRELRLLVDSIRDYAITWLDADGGVASWNIGAERLYGWSAEEIIGQPATLFFPPDTVDEAQRIWAAVRETGRYEGETWRVRRDGTRFLGHAVVTTLLDPAGRMQGFVCVARDVTAQRHADEELRRATAEAERASLAKSKFLAAASHDLRQPVQSLVTLADVLARRAHDPALAQPIDLLSQSVAALSAMLTSLLDISKLDAGVVVPKVEPVTVRAVINRLVEEYAIWADGKGLSLRCAGPACIACTDADLLERILRNLIENALRYTEKGGIVVGCRGQGGQTVHIDVIDTGIGIPSAEWKAIFEEFHQLGNPARDRRLGLGLGLAIVRRLARLLGGDVTVRSVPGRGSTFRVTLPIGEVRAVPMGAAVEPSADDETGAARSVLLIEDDALLRESLELMLEDWGYGVAASENAPDALAWAASHPPPDAVIADYRLTGTMTGVDAVRRLRQAWGRDVPALVITGDTDPTRVEEVHRSGVDIMYKPVSPTALRDKVRRLAS